MRFYDEPKYDEFCQKMKHLDEYHRAVLICSPSIKYAVSILRIYLISERTLLSERGCTKVGRQARADAPLTLHLTSGTPAVPTVRPTKTIRDMRTSCRPLSIRPTTSFATGTPSIILRQFA